MISWKGLGYPGVALRQPVVEPVYDTRNTGDVLIELAHRSRWLGRHSVPMARLCDPLAGTTARCRCWLGNIDRTRFVGSASLQLRQSRQRSLDQRRGRPRSPTVPPRRLLRFLQPGTPLSAPGQKRQRSATTRHSGAWRRGIPAPLTNPIHIFRMKAKRNFRSYST